MAILLTRADVQRLLDMPSTISILEKAFAELAAGNAVMPQRVGASGHSHQWYRRPCSQHA